jgi:hypothetical protein
MPAGRVLAALANVLFFASDVTAFRSPSSSSSSVASETSN